MHVPHLRLPSRVLSLPLQMTRRVHELLLHELAASTVPSHQILLAGFGQGGALAIHAGLSFPHRLAGVISLAGFVATPDKYPGHVHTAQKSTPVLAIHGNSDFTVPVAFARKRYAVLKEAKQPFDLKTEWAMGHFLRSAQHSGSHTLDQRPAAPTLQPARPIDYHTAVHTLLRVCVRIVSCVQ
jgi:predicted peptidase